MYLLFLHELIAGHSLNFSKRSRHVNSICVSSIWWVAHSWWTNQNYIQHIHIVVVWLNSCVHVVQRVHIAGLVVVVIGDVFLNVSQKLIVQIFTCLCKRFKFLSLDAALSVRLTRTWKLNRMIKRKFSNLEKYFQGGPLPQPTCVRDGLNMNHDGPWWRESFEPWKIFGGGPMRQPTWVWVGLNVRQKTATRKKKDMSVKNPSLIDVSVWTVKVPSHWPDHVSVRQQLPDWKLLNLEKYCANQLVSGTGWMWGRKLQRGKRRTCLWRIPLL